MDSKISVIVSKLGCSKLELFTSVNDEKEKKRIQEFFQKKNQKTVVYLMWMTEKEDWMAILWFEFRDLEIWESSYTQFHLESKSHLEIKILNLFGMHWICTLPTIQFNLNYD